jgi:hypothetical protein
MKRLSKFLVLALIVGGGVAGLASAKTINGCEIKPRTHCPGADLRGADLSGANLFSANLSHADLSHAELFSADLREADLSGADLSAADLTDANLTGANLSGINLSGADLRRAKLHPANLRNAIMSHADLSSADLGGADLSGADLSGANVHRANLYGATFCHTRMYDGSENNSGCGSSGRPTAGGQRILRGPSSVIPGRVYSFHISGFIRGEKVYPNVLPVSCPRTSERCEQSPCPSCAVTRIGASGAATVRFRWPKTSLYVVGNMDFRHYRWQRRSSALIRIDLASTRVPRGCKRMPSITANPRAGSVVCAETFAQIK